MKIYIGCDHAAYEEKEAVKSFISELGHDVEDVGPYDAQRCNYPDFATKVARGVQKEGVGVLLCGSGIGVSMVANRYKGIRAALCRTTEDALLSRQHNNANVICVGARISTLDDIKSMIEAWLKEEFQGGRHSQRVAMFTELGEA